MSLPIVATGAAFLKLDGIPGEVLASGYEDALEVTGATVGVSRAVNFERSGGRESGAPLFTELTLSHYGSLASPLLLAAATGALDSVPEATLDFVQNAPDGPIPYARITLRDVVVSSYEQTISSDDGAPTERFSLIFTRFELARLGGGNQIVSAAYWDLDTNTGGQQTGLLSPPALAPISAQTTPEDTALSINLSVSDADTAPSSLSVEVSTNNPALFPPANLTLSGTGALRTLRLTPASDASGAATVTVTVSDGERSASRTFSVTVTAQNDAPHIAYSGPLVIETLANHPVALDGLSLSDVDAGTNPLVFQITQNEGYGWLTLRDTAGVTVNGQESPSLLAMGTLSALQSALADAGLVFSPNYGFPATEYAEAHIGLTLNDQGATGAGGARLDTRELTIRVYQNQRSRWRAEHFLESLSDPAAELTTWGDLADPDSDGVPNLLEFALGLNPREAGAPPLIPEIALPPTPGEMPRLELSFALRDDPRIQWELEICDALGQPWRSAGTTWETVTDSPDGPFRYITVRETAARAGEPRRFVRLRVNYVPFDS